VFYREAGQFKTSYAADQAILPIPQDRWFLMAVLLVAYLVIPVISNEYMLQAVLIPFLVFAMAAIGLNLLLGYAGQLSLGTGGFMAVGAYMTYKMTTAWPEMNIIVVLMLSGL
jgi:branched-chain amino acid transport system permease protein